MLLNLLSVLFATRIRHVQRVEIAGGTSWRSQCGPARDQCGPSSPRGYLDQDVSNNRAVQWAIPRTTMIPLAPIFRGCASGLDTTEHVGLVYVLLLNPNWQPDSQ